MNTTVQLICGTELQVDNTEGNYLGCWLTRFRFPSGLLLFLLQHIIRG